MENNIENFKEVSKKFKHKKYPKDECVRINLDIHQDILKRLKILAAYNDTNNKNLSEDILTNIALEYLPKL